MSAYTSREDAYVAGRASAAVEIIQTRESLDAALLREQELVRELRLVKVQAQKQQWVSLVAAWGCVCLTLVCIALLGRLSQLNSLLQVR